MEIIKDVPRTFSNYDIFSNFYSNYILDYHSMIRKIFRILLVFLEYNNGVDYFQGMNSIVGALAVHVEESKAFWMFIDLLEIYNLDDAYSPDLKGMHIFIAKIKLLMQSKFQAAHDHMLELGVNFEMFTVVWVISFFCAYIPLNLTDIFFEKFFAEGWKVFYQIVFNIFKELEKEILRCQEM